MSISPYEKSLINKAKAEREKAEVEQVERRKVEKEKAEKEKAEIDNKLRTCSTCNHPYSKRADQCPMCGTAITATCGICKNIIPLSIEVCPECGDPNPFECSIETTIDKDTRVGKNKHSQGEKGKIIRLGKIGPIGFIILITSVCVSVFSPNSVYKVSA
jgi:RNA polymerase subunit RPABC4/transcription elongation factor Spt4